MADASNCVSPKTWRYASFQQTCCRSDQQELVVAPCKGVVLRLSSQRVIHGNLQSFHGLNELRGHIRICFPDLPSSHELFDCTNHCFLIFLRRRVCLDHSSVPIPDHKDGLLDSIIVFIDLSVIHVIEGDQVTNFVSFLWNAPLNVLRCFIFARTQDSQYGFLKRCVKRCSLVLASCFSAPLLLKRGSPSSSSTSMMSSSSSHQ